VIRPETARSSATSTARGWDGGEEEEEGRGMIVIVEVKVQLFSELVE